MVTGREDRTGELGFEQCHPCCSPLFKHHEDEKSLYSSLLTTSGSDLKPIIPIWDLRCLRTPSVKTSCKLVFMLVHLFFCVLPLPASAMFRLGCQTLSVERLDPITTPGGVSAHVVSLP